MSMQLRLLLALAVCALAAGWFGLRHQNTALEARAAAPRAEAQR